MRRGSVVVVDLDPTVGREQRGVRPAIVVSDPEVSSDQRYPMLCIVPVTATRGEGALYPKLLPGRSGLTKESYALVDQLRAIHKLRIRQVYGSIQARELAAIDRGLYLFLGLRPPESGSTY
jgi:mRNA interferase MazF